MFLSLFFLMILLPPISTLTDTLFPYTTRFRSRHVAAAFLLGQYRTSPAFCVSCPGARDSPPPSIANRAARRKRSLTRTPRRLPLPAFADKTRATMSEPLISFEPATGDELWRGPVSDVDAEEIGRASCRERVCQYV